MLPACLASISEADEIIVCDTGSTDDTIKIATEANVKLIHYKWDDDFAAARNYVKDHAAHDWVLSIDADEILKPGSVAAIKESISKTDKTVLFVAMTDSKDGSTFNSVRLFNKKHNWVGLIHEALDCCATDSSGGEIIYGYSPTHHVDPKLDLRILLKAVEQYPESARYRYYLGREYYYIKSFLEAEHHFKLCLKYNQWTPERADTFLYLAKINWLESRGEMARKYCMSALNLNAHFAEAARFMASISWEKNAAPWLAMAEAANNSEVLFIRK